MCPANRKYYNICGYLIQIEYLPLFLSSIYLITNLLPNSHHTVAHEGIRTLYEFYYEYIMCII